MLSKEQIEREIRHTRRKVECLRKEIKDLLTDDIIDALYNSNNPGALNTFVTTLDLASIAIGTNIFDVDKFSDLPLANLNSGVYYWVENNEGTQWLPGTLGGTYRPKGLYFSNGTDWTTVDAPINASQAIVDSGINDNRFVTPKTLKNSSQWSTKQDTLVNGTNIKTINGNSLLGAGDMILSTYANIDGGNSLSIFGGVPNIDGGNSNSF